MAGTDDTNPSPTTGPTVRQVEVGGGMGSGLGMLRAALPTVPVVNQLPGVRKTSKTLPDLEVRREATVERAAVDAYATVCGFPRKDTAPVTYLHMLAFPLHMAIMTDAAFPFPAIGTVHLENSITSCRPVRVGESVAISARAANLRVSTKGRVFDLVVDVSADGEQVWESTSTYLRLGGGDKENGDPGRSLEAVPAGGIPWRLPADLGRRYAAVSGDHNPIHLYPLTAKAFGFKRQIAHGMWSLARSVAALENRLPDAVTIEAAFKKPIFLPGTVSFGLREAGDELEFTLCDARTGAPHVLGRTTPA